MNVAIRHDYRPLLGPVRDQGARPTCLAHASTTAHEHARGLKVALSPEYLHYFASVRRAGVDGRSAAKLIEADTQLDACARSRSHWCVDDLAASEKNISATRDP